MSLRLAIDLGTTSVTAAVRRRSRVVVVPTATIDACGIKRLLRDPAPVDVGTSSVPPHQVAAGLIDRVVAAVVAAVGSEPADLVLTHPASDTPEQIAQLRTAAHRAGFAAHLVSDAEGAVVDLLQKRRIAPGRSVLVYDFGGGTVDTSLVCVDGEHMEIVGEPETLERMGGIDIDAAIAQVVTSRGGSADEATARAAKERLSKVNETTAGGVVVTRADVEEVVGPLLASTMDAVRRTVASAGLNMHDLDSVLLVGGSARIPLVLDVVRRETQLPVVVSERPEHAAALGAARLAVR